MFIERDDTTFDRAGTWLVLLLIATTLCTVILQDFDRPLSDQTADTEQREDSESAPEASLTVVEAVTSSVDLSVDSNYFLIDVLPVPGSHVSYPRPDDVSLDRCLKLSRILFSRIISPNAP